MRAATIRGNELQSVRSDGIKLGPNRDFFLRHDDALRIESICKLIGKLRNRSPSLEAPAKGSLKGVGLSRRYRLAHAEAASQRLDRRKGTPEPPSRCSCHYRIGKCKMRDRIVVHTLPLMVASLLPWSLGFVRPICGTVVTAASAWKVVLTWWLGPKTA